MKTAKQRKRKPKTLADYPAAYREALSAFEAFRRLGISADDLYIGFANVVGFGEDMLFVEARQGDKRFHYVAGPLPGAQYEEIAATWPIVCALWNSGPQEETMPIWEASGIARQSVPLILRLRAKGFEFPDRTAN